VSAATALHDRLVSLAARARRRRKLPPRRDWKINLGSGLVVAPGWTNIDMGLPVLLASWPGPVHRVVHRLLPPTSAIKRDYSGAEMARILREHEFVHHDVRYGIPVPDASVAFIYTSHFLEHMFVDDAIALLRDARRVLRPGGLLRVCVPDLAHALDLFRDGDHRRALGFFFLGPGVSALTRHRYMWGFEMLRDELLKAGFASVTRCGYRSGDTPDLETLDNRPDETLYVEARAPGFVQTFEG
jgi:SAM-dependent methyltransferase